MTNRKYKIEVGQKIKQLTMLEEISERKNCEIIGLFLCECGNTKKISIKSVCIGRTVSCGCKSQKRNKMGINLKHGCSKDRLYNIWEHMRRRCYNVKTKYYKYYGGRGITVCDDWKNDFTKFKEWATNNGYEEHLTIERKDVNKGYYPNNCCWITLGQQRSNRTDTIKYKAFDEEKLLSYWAKDDRCIVSYETLRRRVSKGWNVEKAMTTYIRKPKQ